MKSLKFALFLAVLVLAACASHPQKTALPPVEAKLDFQFGQSALVRLDSKTDPALRAAFLHWVYQGVYKEAPVYRQLPGVFILTGKPRLAGQGFQYGTIPTPDPKGKQPKSAKTGEVGLVVHSDGTVGPELIIHYGHSVVSCCEEPANIRIGRFVGDRTELKSIQRGDNLTNIAIQP